MTVDDSSLYHAFEWNKNNKKRKDTADIKTKPNEMKEKKQNKNQGMRNVEIKES